MASTRLKMLVACGLATVAVAGTGCAGSFQEKLRKISAVDLNCPKEEIQLELISGRWAMQGANAVARGCGSQGRYVLAEGAGWVLNADTRPIN